MRPWPAILAERYPPSPLTGTATRYVKARPWWLLDAVSSAGLLTFTRTDGFRFLRAGFVDVPPTDEGFLVEIEKLDAKHPIPHPGFRAGQAWGLVGDHGGCNVLVLAEDYDGGADDPDHPAGRWFSFASPPGERRSETVGVRSVAHVREDRLRDLLAEAFLVADPCCPWLAPWSPA